MAYQAQPSASPLAQDITESLVRQYGAAARQIARWEADDATMAGDKARAEFYRSVVNAIARKL
jgi:hypothetical protein